MADPSTELSELRAEVAELREQLQRMRAEAPAPSIGDLDEELSRRSAGARYAPIFRRARLQAGLAAEMRPSLATSSTMA